MQSEGSDRNAEPLDGVADDTGALQHDHFTGARGALEQAEEHRFRPPEPEARNDVHHAHSASRILHRGRMLSSDFVIGKREGSNLWWVLRQKESYLAVLRALWILESPFPLIRDEIFSRSLRSATVRVRTPSGPVAIHLNGPVDLSTLFGVFCRNDYRAGRRLNVAIDIGANLGIATLYFLTRNANSFVYAYEPVARNVETFLFNAAPYAGRYELSQTAVGARSGIVSFGVEPTGKFGGITAPYTERIDVECVAINDVLERVLSKHSEIDILKIDVEGTEQEIIAAIAPQFWRRIRCVYSENSSSAALIPDDFRRTFRYNVERLQRL